MKNKFNDIFDNHNTSVSPKEMHRYASGKMSETERHNFELAMQSDPFLEEAMDGFLENKEAITQLKNNSFSKDFFTTKLILGGILIGSIAVFSWWFVNPNNVMSINNQQKNQVSVKQQDDKKVPHELLENEKSKIITSQITDSSIQITIGSNSMSAVQTTLPLDKFVTIEKVDSIDKIELLVTPLDELKDSLYKTKVKALSRKKHPYYHILNYKVVDYKDKREEPIETLTPIITGTPANQENNNATPTNEELNIKIYYNEYLEKSMVFFHQKKYRKAIKRYKIILDHYPKDANALFYLAMSYTYTKKYDLANTHFTKYLKQDINTFKEDVEFYQAIGLLHLEQEKKANQILQRIINENGFYANQAKEKLKIK